MPGILETLLAGVISGLIATGCVAVFRSVWVGIVFPKIENWLYGDVRIDGEWRSEFAGLGGTDIGAITVVQVGHHIRGTIHCYEGPDQGRIFTFTGEFRNRILTGMYVARRVNSLDRGTFALQIGDNGDRLAGRCIYYKDQTDTLEVASQYTWVRCPKELPAARQGAVTESGKKEGAAA